MPESNRDVSHLVLQLCAAKGPDGLFYPRVDAANLDVDRSLLDATLDQLRLAGFVEIGDWTQQHGQGYRLTDAGWAASDRPELLRKPVRPQLRIVRAPSSDWEQADEIRRSVMEPPPAIATRILFAINVAVFVMTCVWLTRQGVSLTDVISGRSIIPIPGDPNHVLFVPIPGGMSPIEFYAGDWWRIFTYMFVHNGIMHIGTNMFCLYTLGNLLEGRWGWKRFLVVYLGSGLMGGVAVLLASNPLVSVVGASGAICGLMTSVGVWAWMHREYLPPQFVAAHFRMVGINLLIMIGVSVLPNISLAGHVGGAIGGALLSVPLTWMGPFSPLRHRIIGVVSLILIAAACVFVVEIRPRFGFGDVDRRIEMRHR